MSLSQLLKEGTTLAHRQAERAPLIASLSSGRLERGAYAQLLADAAAVYEALEESLVRHIAHVIVGGVYFPELLRREAISADQAVFGRGTPSLEATRYAAHLRTLAVERPIDLIAHVYTRYLGDLSGGQILKRLVQRNFGLGAEGTAFYEFPLIDDLPAFKAKFRERLDALPLSEAQQQALVVEANRAFALSETLLLAAREPETVVLTV